MRGLIWASILCILVSGCRNTPPGGVFGPGELPMSICLVREMEPIEETAWTPCSTNAYPSDVSRALADWEKKRPWVEKQLTADVVRGISRWARPEMETYKSVPALSRVQLRPIASRGTGNSHRRILLEGTVDTLPSHAPGTVTRWLKIYVVYDSEIWRVTKIIVTIRGQRLE